MASKVQLLEPCTVVGFDGILRVCASTPVEIYSVATAGVVATVTTDAQGKMPDASVADAVGATMILRIVNFQGFCGCIAVTTITP